MKNATVFNLLIISLAGLSTLNFGTGHEDIIHFVISGVLLLLVSTLTLPIVIMHLSRLTDGVRYLRICYRVVYQEFKAGNGFRSSLFTLYVRGIVILSILGITGNLIAFWVLLFDYILLSVTVTDLKRLHHEIVANGNEVDFIKFIESLDEQNV